MKNGTNKLHIFHDNRENVFRFLQNSEKAFRAHENLLPSMGKEISTAGIKGEYGF